MDFDVSSSALLLMNVFILVVMAIVIAFIIIQYRSNSINFKKQREDINKIILYIRYFDNLLVQLLMIMQSHTDDITLLKKKALELRNLMDLDEFKNLSPELKAKYKKYIVNQLMPALATIMNKRAKDNDQMSDASLQLSINSLVAASEKGSDDEFKKIFGDIVFTLV